MFFPRRGRNWLLFLRGTHISPSPPQRHPSLGSFSRSCVVRVMC